MLGSTPTPDELIIENMKLAEMVGLKYAHRKNRYAPEAVAEAYYHLVVFFRKDIRLYHAKPEDYKPTLGIYIKRALIKYFERMSPKLGEVYPEELIQKNTDEEMIDYLSGVIPDEKVWPIFHLIRSGLSIYEIEMVDRSLWKCLKKVRTEVKNRLKRLDELKRLGIKTSREVIRFPDPVEEEDGDFLAAA